MNLKTLGRIIPIIGGGVMLVWGFLGNAWGISWIAAAIGGVISGVLHAVDQSKGE
jgi:hypothetical protein